MRNKKYGERLLGDVRAYLENPFAVVESDTLGDLLKFVREHVNTLGFYYGKAGRGEARSRLLLARKTCQLQVSLLEEVGKIAQTLSPSLKVRGVCYAMCRNEIRSKVSPILEQRPAEAIGIDGGKVW